MAVSSVKSSLPLFEFDRKLCGRSEIAGADEAGRGSLAGPLVVAAVVFDYATYEPARLAGLLDGLTDSKKLTAQARSRLFPRIIRFASRFSVIVTGNRTIDEKGLHKTNLYSLSRGLAALEPFPETMLIDGRQQLPELPETPEGFLRHRPITRGDSKSACIAAASIIAKVTRDRLMHMLHPLYPQYGFDSHVGYATREHRQAIATHGYCRLHRRSFKLAPLTND